jgi:hypothetical protein
MPKTAADALKQWLAGEAVPAFQVEAETASQEEVYAAAFELIALDREFSIEDAAASLTDREREVAYSIATVAINKGWGAMVRQHIGQHIAGIEVRKP